jgi:NAD-dependent dihydropyrimidine dehydrogenase PreA subunit
MSTKSVSPAQLEVWVDRLIATTRVYGVQAKEDRFAYGPLARAADLRLDFDVTILPPKKFFQPLVETIMKFHKDGHYEPVVDEEPFIIFGVHPYDVVAIRQMDAVFSKDYVDVHYMSRRERATIVACDIQNASPSIFAASMGTAVVKDGFDVLLTKVDDAYVVDVRTEKGEALLAALGDVPDADAMQLARREQFWEDAGRFLNKYLLKCAPTDLPVLLEKHYDNPIWEHNAALCYSCGSCNMVCPTCYCFDVQDNVDWSLESGERVRKWDACQLRDFAQVAGGHNFRRRREERYRHRYYRKGQYLWKRMQQIACVGCGRCTTACTAKIANPVELYNALLEG